MKGLRKNKGKTKWVQIDRVKTEYENAIKIQIKKTWSSVFKTAFYFCLPCEFLELRTPYTSVRNLLVQLYHLNKQTLP